MRHLRRVIIWWLRWAEGERVSAEWLTRHQREQLEIYEGVSWQWPLKKGE